MTHLILDNGHVVDNPVEISKYVREFYSDLFSPGLVTRASQQLLMSGLKQISEEERQTCGKSLTFNELTIAVKSSSINKSPGLDGLPVNFFLHFWDLIGMDLYDVIIFSIEKGELPLSCRRSILSLLPKEGNNGYIKNI